jgi:PBSX family phage terminase large subunit
MSSAQQRSDDELFEISLEEITNFTPKQQETFDCIGVYSDIFAGGARGGGKSHLSVAAAVTCAIQVPGLRILVARKTSDELRQKLLDDLLLKLYYPGILFQWHASTLTAKFDNGSVIYFKSFEHVTDISKVKGVDYGLIILDEGNEFEEEFIRMMRGSLRAFDIPDWKPTLLMTGNPLGICDQYIMDYYIDPNYSKWSEKELKRKDDFKYVHFTVYDNPYATEEYIDQLDSQTPEVRKAWLEGDWKAVRGQFFSEWAPNADEYGHVVEPFDIPKDWTRVRAIDLGYGKHPSVCLFGAQDPDTGFLYVYDEVSTTETTDVFISMVAISSGDDEFAATYFDPNSMKSRRGETSDTQTPAQMFMNEGIYVEPADNARENGWRIVKMWMRRDLERGVHPKLYVFSNCEGLISSIPKQRYIPNKMDLNTKGQDDFVDALRYMLSKIPYGAAILSDGSVDTERYLHSFGNSSRRYPSRPTASVERPRYPNKDRDAQGSIYSSY